MEFMTPSFFSAPNVKRWALALVITAVFVSLMAFPSLAQSLNKTASDEAHSSSLPPTTRRTVRLVANDMYEAGWLHRFFFGSKYREVWATPIEVEVLDLGQYAGGLTLIRGGGTEQTKTLHLQGANGRRYVFRPINKETLSREKYGLSIFQELMQDLKVSAFHPAAALVAAPLSEALDILYVTPKLYVMPDAPPLDSLTQLYSGILGQLEERPDGETETNPGFGGAIRVSDTNRLLEHLKESSYHR
ncbi:MAG: hypothetical protein E2O85_00205, partial [Bacteroidetes bacterium]